MKTEIYNNESFCLSELCVARDVFCNKHTTKEQYRIMEKCLSIMYLWCSDTIKTTVLSVLEEAERRRVYFELIWNK